MIVPLRGLDLRTNRTRRVHYIACDEAIHGIVGQFHESPGKDDPETCAIQKSTNVGSLSATNAASSARYEKNP